MPGPSTHLGIWRSKTQISEDLQKSKLQTSEKESIAGSTAWVDSPFTIHDLTPDDPRVVTQRRLHDEGSCSLDVFDFWICLGFGAWHLGFRSLDRLPAI
jgi:hypothetical protein